MLDIGWTELVVIAIVLIVVVGPKDLPPMLRAFGRMTGKMRGMAADFRRQFDEALREADLDDVRKTISDAQSLNPTTALRDAMNPLRQLGDEIKSDLQKASTPEKPAHPAMSEPAAAATTTAAAATTSASNPVAAAAIGSGPQSMDSAPAAKATETKPKRAAKAKAAPASATSPAPAAQEAKKSAGAATVKKAVVKKAEAQAATKNQKTRAASRRKGDA